MMEEEKWVEDCWLVCLDDKHSLIPAFKIYVEESEEELNALNFFINQILLQHQSAVLN